MEWLGTVGCNWCTLYPRVMKYWKRSTWETCVEVIRIISWGITYKRPLISISCTFPIHFLLACCLFETILATLHLLRLGLSWSPMKWESLGHLGACRALLRFLEPWSMSDLTLLPRENAGQSDKMFNLDLQGGLDTRWLDTCRRMGTLPY